MRVTLLFGLVLLTSSVAFAQGAANYALHFDGLDDFAVVLDDPSFDFGHTDEFSIELWIQIPSGPTAPGIFSVLEKWSGQCGVPYPFTIRIHPSANARCLSFDGISCTTGSGIAYDPDPSLDDGAWHHVAYTRCSDLVSRLFIDGQLVDENPVPPLAATSNGNPLYIGKRGPGGPYANHFAGLLDEVRISNVCRYLAPFRPVPYHTSDSNTVLLLHFNDGTPVTADASSYGNDAILGGNSAGIVATSPAYVASTLPGSPAGLISAVNGGSYDSSIKTFRNGSTLRFDVDETQFPGMGNERVSYVLNYGAWALMNGVSINGGPLLFGLNAVSNVSTPSGVALIFGDGLRLVNEGYGTNGGGARQRIRNGPFSVVLGSAVPPGFEIRVQAVYSLPDAPVLGVGITNEVRFTAIP